MSMKKNRFERSGEEKAVTSPWSLVITAYSRPVSDLFRVISVFPDLQNKGRLTRLLLIDLGDRVTLVD